MLARSATAALSTLAIAACGHGSAGPASAPSAGGEGGSLSLAIEGPCPKLRIWDTGKELALVYGTYGLEGATPIEARSRLSAEQSFGFLRPTGIELRPAMFVGLQRNARGYVPLDIELGGEFPRAAWLSRSDTRLAKAHQGALFERSRSYAVWEDGRWTESPTGSDVVLSGLRTPPFIEGRICTRFGENVHYARHATERIPAGAVITAGRCEDELQRAQGGVVAATLASDDGRWVVHQMPSSSMFEGIVNIDLVYPSRTEAYLYAYTPYDESPRPAYLLRWDGAQWAQQTVPFAGPIVSMARTSDGVLWAVARFREVWARSPAGVWSAVTLPPSRFADRTPTDVRIIEIQSTGSAAWIHAAYPIAVRPNAGAGEARPSRSHLLFTTRPWKKPLFCDASRPAATALDAEGRTLEVAKFARVERSFE